MRGDVIFFFDLPTVYNQSVHLFIKYINGYNSSQSYNRTTTIGFVNTQSIQHVEYSSQVYYNRFQVKAGLVSRGVHGPLLLSPGLYGMLTIISIIFLWYTGMYYSKTILQLSCISAQEWLIVSGQQFSL